MKKLYSIVVAFLMFFNLSLFAQDSPPWDFNGTDHGFIAQNYASLTVGDTYITYTLNDADGDGDAESPNSNIRNLAELKENVFEEKKIINSDNFIDLFVIVDQKLVNFNFNKYTIKSYKKLDDLNKSKKLDYSLELS